jgi:hypothetical protein
VHLRALRYRKIVAVSAKALTRFQIHSLALAATQQALFPRTL